VAISSSLESFDQLCGFSFWGIRVASDIPLTAMPQSPFQLVPIGIGHLGEMKGKGVAQVVGAQWRETTFGISLLSIIVLAT
jgi:hypothetical protein